MRSFLFFLLLGWTSLWADDFFGKARMVEGEVSYIRLFKSYPAKAEMDFLNKDKVNTKKLSRLLIRLFKGSDLFIDENTEMVLSRNSIEEKIHLELLTGTMHGTLKDLKGHQLEVFTKVGSVQVVGTEFIVSYEPALGKGLDVQVLEGEVKVILEGIQGPVRPSFKVGEKRRIQIGGQGAPVKQEPAQETVLKRMRELRTLIRGFDEEDGDEEEEEDDRPGRRNPPGEEDQDNDDEGDEEEGDDEDEPQSRRGPGRGDGPDGGEEDFDEKEGEEEGEPRRGEEDGPLPHHGDELPDLDDEEGFDEEDEFGDEEGPHGDGPEDGEPLPHEGHDEPLHPEGPPPEDFIPDEIEDELFNDDIIDILKDEILKDLKVDFTLGD